jgi:hypothetical protein
MLHCTGYNRVNVTLCRPGKAGVAKSDPEMGTRIRGALSELGNGAGKRETSAVGRRREGGLRGLVMAWHRAGWCLGTGLGSARVPGWMVLG